MPKFSKRSNMRLETCHPDLQKIFKHIIKHNNCTILEGHRTNAKQQELFENGSSKVKAGKSKHNKYPSLAVDVAPYPIFWEEKERFLFFGGYVKSVADTLNIKIRWGGDWDGDGNFKDQTFNDYVHFELLED